MLSGHSCHHHRYVTLLQPRSGIVTLLSGSESMSVQRPYGLVAAG